jgi:O-acetyl-ADP-ribose deacetylase
MIWRDVPEVMDPLSDVLRAVRLTGAFFYVVETTEPWSATVAPARELVPRVLPGAEHLMAYHIVTAGSCWMGCEGDEQVLLEAGDAIVFPHGDSHFASGRRGHRVDPRRYSAAPSRPLETIRLGAAGSPAAASLVCGFLGCDARPYNPLLSALPRSLHARGIAAGWLAEFPRQVVAEAWQTRAGGTTMLTRMAELMFVEIVRRYTDELSPRQAGVARRPARPGGRARDRGAPHAARAPVDAGGARAGCGDVSHGADRTILPDRGAAPDAVPDGVAAPARHRAARHRLEKGGGRGDGRRLRIGGSVQPGVQTEYRLRARGVAADATARGDRVTTVSAQRVDITTLALDAIVNAANEQLAPGAGVCGAIHRAAGPELARVCAALGGCPTGDARITAGFDLPARSVIHAVGPMWQGGSAAEPELLASAYRSSMQLAAEHDLTSIAFPAISTGIYGYPLRPATEIALRTVMAELAEGSPVDTVIFACFSLEVLAAYHQAGVP